MPKPKTKMDRNHDYYPIINCVNEKITIGLSFVKLTASTLKVDKSQWQKNNCKFLKGYAIDFGKFKEGDIILCPKCGKPVSFDSFVSDTRPDLIDAPCT